LYQLNRPRRFFFSFFNLVRFTSAQLASSSPFPLPDIACPQSDVVTPCHTSFPLSQDELVASASSSSNFSFRRLPSRAETKALNLHHHRRLPFPNLPTPTLHNCKKSISTLITLPTTQLCLHLAFSLARASHHQSSARHHCSLSQLSHVHRPFA
jgi:hypothetical protein